jgi:DNA-directed RNA polymerase specialized sigma24 family protein
MNPPVRFRGDELDLYAEFHFELVRKVQNRVSTSRENVDDACAFAWVQFFAHQPDRDGAWKGWLYRVATREAFTLDKLARRDADLVGDRGQDIDVVDPRDRPAELDEFLSAMQELQRLPPRLQQLVLLRSQVDTQQEVADRVGLSSAAFPYCSPRSRGWSTLAATGSRSRTPRYRHARPDCENSRRIRRYG